MVLEIFLNLIEQFLVQGMFLLVLLWALKFALSFAFAWLANLLHTKSRY